jgi:hypothetical protein
MHGETSARDSSSSQNLHECSVGTSLLLHRYATSAFRMREKTSGLERHTLC